jgi:Cdc6-like AAA superfamily ATPase
LVTIIEWSAILSAAAALLLTVFALDQLRHMEKHRNVDISMKLFEWGEDERLRKALKWVEKDFQFEDYEKYQA